MEKMRKREKIASKASPKTKNSKLEIVFLFFKCCYMAIYEEPI